MASTNTPPPNRTPTTPQRVILLGSTGSIGVNTLKVVDNLSPNFKIEALAAGTNAELIIQQAKQFKPKAIALADESAATVARNQLPDIKIFSGPAAADKLVESIDADILISAVVGAAGLPATLSAIKKGMTIGLANKETLVAAGELVMPLIKKHNVNLLPIDSEHSAIFQCLQTSGGTAEPKTVKRIVLTASGGPFRTATKQQIQNATVDQALNHPTWNMGPKITIDSATMMNKALEIIEAHWLFGLSPDQIDVIIHPQSIVHSFVEFTDNSILAQLGSPDMKTPIQYALTYPNRTPGISQPLDFATLSTLDFEQPDHDRFGALSLAYRAIEAGGTAGAILNAANEAAVAAFLARKITFGQITSLVAKAMDGIRLQKITSLDTVLTADRAARAFINEQIQN